LPILFFLSEGITLFVFRVFGYRRKVVFENLEYSFPTLSEKEIKHIGRKYYRHLSVMMVENIYLRFISLKQLKKRLVVKNPELFNRYFHENRNVIVVLGHFGNWEFGSGIVHFIKHRGLAVYKKLTSPVFDKIYFDIRSRLGVEPVEMSSVFKTILNQKVIKQPYALFMVADQAPMRGDPQYLTTFLNQKTGFYLGTEKLAKRFDMPVIYIELHRAKKGYYNLTPTLITDQPKETAENEITQRYIDLLEKSIVNSPRYWLWSHKRWKHKF
jgi:KDO2-lipid IV(A) lauroyltransferase